MVVGIARIVLGIPESRSLKDKRAVVRRVIDRVRHKFNAAVAEVSDLDAHRRATIGITVISNDARHASSMLSTISSFVASASPAVVVDVATHLETYSEGFGTAGVGAFGSRDALEHRPDLDFGAGDGGDDDGEP